MSLNIQRSITFQIYKINQIIKIYNFCRNNKVVCCTIDRVDSRPLSTGTYHHYTPQGGYQTMVKCLGRKRFRCSNAHPNNPSYLALDVVVETNKDGHVFGNK